MLWEHRRVPDRPWGDWKESRKDSLKFLLGRGWLRRSVWRQGEKQRGRPTTIYSIKKMQAHRLSSCPGMVQLMWELGTPERRGWRRVTEVVYFGNKELRVVKPRITGPAAETLWVEP